MLASVVRSRRLAVMAEMPQQIGKVQLNTSSVRHNIRFQILDTASWNWGIGLGEMWPKRACDCRNKSVFPHPIEKIP